MDKRIQEDHLHQLALFSEYGRMAQNEQHEIPASGSVEEGTDGGAGWGVSQDRVERPFQRLEFLVRDWQVRGLGLGRDCPVGNLMLRCLRDTVHTPV